MEEAASGKHHSLLSDSTLVSPVAGRGTTHPTGRSHKVGFPPPGLRIRPSRDDHAGPLFMLLEPRQGGKAQRFIGEVAKHQPVPGSGLVEPPHLPILRLGRCLSLESGTRWQ
jgi:hypothetical protein